MKLYDIPAQIDDFERLLEDGGGELTPELEQRWTDFIKGSREKIEAGAMVVKNLEAQEKACAEEAKRLYAKQKQHERNTQRLKDLMVYAVDALGGKVKTPLFSIWCQNSAPQIKVELKEGSDLVEIGKTHPELVRVKREPNLENIKLLAATDPKAVPEQFIVSHSAGTRYLRIK
jgi:superfamily I DNA and/or RNA helicase